MNAEWSDSQQDAVPTGRRSRSKRAILLVVMTAVISVVAIAFVRPWFHEWLELRDAHRNLTSTDYDAWNDAIRRLRQSGVDMEGELIPLLHHSEQRVRRYAATELAYKTPWTDTVIESFLVALENNQHVPDIGQAAPKLFYRYAEDTSGPLTETHRRMTAWLTAELSSPIPEQSGLAAWSLTAFESRDPALREQLTAWLEDAAFFERYIVLREMENRDPSLHDEYIEVLLSGLQSPVSSDQQNAQFGLTHLDSAPDDLNSRLEAIRDASTDERRISRINATLMQLRENDADHP